MNYYHYLVMEILLLIMAIAVLRTVGKDSSVLQNWASRILTVALLVVCLVWTMDTVLWLLVESMQSIHAVQSSMLSQWDIDLPLPKMIM